VNEVRCYFLSRLCCYIFLGIRYFSTPLILDFSMVHSSVMVTLCSGQQLKEPRPIQQHSNSQYHLRVDLSKLMTEIIKMKFELLVIDGLLCMR